MEATADWIISGTIVPIALAVFTAALVVVTGRYVGQTKQMVEEMRLSSEEMRRSRELSVLPKLAIDVRAIAEMLVGLELTNVGQGPALELELAITFEPAKGSGYHRDVRAWRAKVLARDERRRFVPPRDQQGEPLRVPAFGQAYAEVTVEGRMRDVLGQEHGIDERVEDLAGRHELTAGAAVIAESDPVCEELRKLRETVEKAARKDER